jgi:hypothetical protein
MPQILVESEALETIKRMCAELEKDAARYRFLRLSTTRIPITHEQALDPVKYDAAVDAAMGKQGGV